MPERGGEGSVVGGRLGLEAMREQRNNMNKDPLWKGTKQRGRVSPQVMTFPLL